MGIRARTIIAVAVVATLLGLVVMIVIGRAVYKLLRDQETVEVSRTLARAEEAIRLQADAMTVHGEDWARWDESYDFIETRDPAWIDANLHPDTLETLHLDFMAFFDRSGDVVASETRDYLATGQDRLPVGVTSLVVEHPELLRAEADAGARSGILNLQGGPAFVSTHPVVKTDGSGPARGTLVMGTFIEPDEVRQLARVVGHRVYLYHRPKATDAALVATAWKSLGSWQEHLVVPSGKDTISGFSLADGIDGEPALMLAVTEPRTGLMLARRSLWYFISAALFGIAFSIVVLAILLDRVVLHRLKLLSAGVNHVAETGDFNARVAEVGHDEVTLLAKDVNSMLVALQASETELAFLAGHDPLTHLYNRRRFEEELEREISEHSRLGHSFAMLWLDIDHFKEVNDTLGHGAGDRLLTWFGEKLSHETRAYGTIARLGGDEFAVLAPHADEDEAMGMARRLVDSMEGQTIAIEGHEVQLSASIGVVLFPVHGRTPSELLATADLAMYHAKESGRGRVALFTDEWQQELSSHLEWAERITAALNDGRFVLYAQPILNAISGENGRFELLLRMIDVDGSVVMPNDFIPVAEKIGLIRDIDRWVALHAIDLLSDERAAGRDTTFSINVSGRGFTDPDLPTIIKEALANRGVDPSRLVIEITETAAVTDISAAQEFIRTLRDVGCKFSIDDFGSGSASFAYLKHLDVDYLKLDGSLVKGLRTAADDAHFVRAIVEMCKALGIETIAEFVEDEQLFDAVRKARVDFAQGYYIGRPAPLEISVTQAATRGGRVRPAEGSVSIAPT
ncbi:MAG: EAL domain-containing protein [Coriobacteriales bacterium]|nr:EAL domain-containing protein [Coriobacteriales bacterium]